MRLPGRLAAAIEVLAEVENRHRPVGEALKSWGLAHRFAGAGDRAAIGNLVYDALRRRASHAWAMRSDAPRQLVLSVAVREWGETPDSLARAFSGDRFAPPALTHDEMSRLAAPDPLAAAPDHVRADLPEGLVPDLRRSLGADWLDQGRALAGRPPLDLRANTLKSSRERAVRALRRFGPFPDGIAPDGIRIAAGERESRTPNIQVEEAWRKGWVEVQDQGSQLVSMLAGATPGEQVLDLCAGAGGKTLAMAATMQNRGQIFAYDTDRVRLAPIHARLQRAGVRNVQVRAPAPGVLDDLVGRLDRVVIDAPCTGSGTWRRRPEAKWKLTPDQLALRVAEQRDILAAGSRFVRPGGVLVYITCSVLSPENQGQVEAFLAASPAFEAIPGHSLWHAARGGTGSRALFSSEGGLTVTPHTTGTDGFYVVLLRRRP